MPLCAYLSSASLHESQPAMVLRQRVAARAISNDGGGT